MELTLLRGGLTGAVLVYAALKYSALKVAEAVKLFTSALLHRVPLPIGKTKSAEPSLEMGPDTKLADEPRDL